MISVLKAFELALTKTEQREWAQLTSPRKIQDFLDGIPYSNEWGYRCPLRVLRERVAHCFDGALFGAVALRHLGHPPLIVNMLANDQDDDHMLALYRRDGHWGAVAKSNYTGCRWREPVYRTLRELALSYFNIYFNLRRERTLRRYSVPVNLKRFDAQHWMTTDKPVWFIVYHLFDIKHFPLLTKGQEKRLHRVDERLFQAECLGKAYKPNC